MVTNKGYFSLVSFEGGAYLDIGLADSRFID